MKTGCVLRRICCAGLLALLLAWPALTQNAPSTDKPQAAHPQSAKSSAMVLDERVKRLAKALELTESQQVQVKAILEQRQQRLLSIRQNPGLTGSDRIDQFHTLQVQTTERIRAILNDEQRQKYDPLAAKRVQDQQPLPNVEDWMKPNKPQ